MNDLDKKIYPKTLTIAGKTFKHLRGNNYYCDTTHPSGRKSRRVVKWFNEKDPDSISLTKQEFAQESNINNIMRRYQSLGLNPHMDPSGLPDGDFSNVTDYHSAMNALLAAQESFNQLPSQVRKKFANDPGVFLDFMSDPKNKDEAEKLGLLQPPPQREKIDDAVDALKEVVKNTSKPAKKPAPDSTGGD